MERADSHLRITVRGTGRGISEEFLPHLLDRFQNAGVGLSSASGSNGFGLAFTRHLVELHGGRTRTLSLGRLLGTHHNNL